MTLFLNYGKKIEQYDFKVINEREARAAAGIMFFLGLSSLFSVQILRTIFWAELFSITFIIEFIIRTLINPSYAPYMLIGGFIVNNQEPEWVEAKPKQFAWLLGLGLGLIMTFYILFDIISVIRLSICWLCLFLLFVESVFGICLGCLLYKKLNWKVYKCPGGVCEITNKKPYEKRKLILIFGFLALFFLAYISLKYFKYSEPQQIIVIQDDL